MQCSGGTGRFIMPLVLKVTQLFENDHIIFVEVIVVVDHRSPGIDITSDVFKLAVFKLSIGHSNSSVNIHDTIMLNPFNTLKKSGEIWSRELNEDNDTSWRFLKTTAGSYRLYLSY
jgi:hypothetical protein